MVSTCDSSFAPQAICRICVTVSLCNMFLVSCSMDKAAATCHCALNVAVISKPTTSVGVPQAGTELALRFAYWDFFGQARPSCLPYIALTCIHIQEAPSNNCSWRNPTPLHISTLYKSHEWACHMTSSTAVVFRHHCTICVTHYTALNQLILMHFSRIRTLPLGSWRAPFLYIKHVASPVGESREIVLSGRGQAGYRKWLWGRNQKVLHGYISSRHHQAAPNGNSLAKQTDAQREINPFARISWSTRWRHQKVLFYDFRPHANWKMFPERTLTREGWKRDNKMSPIEQSSKVQAFGSMRRFWKSLPRSKKTTFRGPGFVFWNQAPEISRTVFWVYETVLTKTFPPAKRFSWLFLWNRQTWLGRLLWIRISTQVAQSCPDFHYDIQQG